MIGRALGDELEDLRLARGERSKSGGPVWFIGHRPLRNSLISRRVTLDESSASPAGIRMSIRTTSGLRSRLICAACCPSEAVPTTAKSGCVSSSLAKPDRTTSWSSATMIRTACAPVLT
jgi:hypothetical protein